jgi:hypothetical protein
VLDDVHTATTDHAMRRDMGYWPRLRGDDARRKCPGLSFPEIAAEMVLSRTTIKSQAMSIYRKLGTSSRSQAVARSPALGLGLLEG